LPLMVPVDDNGKGNGATGSHCIRPAATAAANLCPCSFVLLVVVAAAVAVAAASSAAAAAAIVVVVNKNNKHNNDAIIVTTIMIKDDILPTPQKIALETW